MRMKKHLLLSIVCNKFQWDGSDAENVPQKSCRPVFKFIVGIRIVVKVEPSEELHKDYERVRINRTMDMMKNLFFSHCCGWE